MKIINYFLIGVGLPATALVAQTQQTYFGSSATGQLVLTNVVNVLQKSQSAQASFSNPLTAQIRTPFGASALGRGLTPEVQTQDEISDIEVRRSMGPLRPPLSLDRRPMRFQLLPRAMSVSPSLGLSPSAQGLSVNTSSGAFGFMGLTHFDQRNANHGNQYSVEPPNVSIGVGNGFVLEGVNNAIQIYTTSGTPQLPVVISSNQLFGVTPAIIWNTGVNGVYPTDMRVFYDQGLNRFFVMQRAQDYDAPGNPLASSHLYLAVSQTGDPTGSYNIYVMDTTNPLNPGCPCIADYPGIGADQYGVYITWDEYDTGFGFRDAVVMALSKQSLGADAVTPTAVKFTIPMNGGYEFALQPAVTPPGASYFLASGGLEYFVSSQISFSSDTNVALWAMTNTSSLLSPNPGVTLLKIKVPTLAYVFPDVANQKPGPRPLGSSMFMPLPVLDGSDSRIQTVTYAGGRLYVTLGTQVTDDGGRSRSGGAYIVISPAYRAGTLTGSSLRQGYLIANGEHLLRPAMAVNAQGKGAIVFTLTGTDYYPSAAFVTFDSFTTGSTIQIAGLGALPEDGFTAYSGGGLARWGDYSTAVVDSDGSIWMGAEYIPNAPRTSAANWGTYLFKVVP